ncbi:hypothetical protein IWZ03DRAFT_433832 [Phyllosticta citriasiana]|uniref:Uncharacterized protein n=1 Tax=Phyllosticta citriasiana TaxID=595635 RepID=A0ABR1K8U6_9PEZI
MARQRKKDKAASDLHLGEGQERDLSNLRRPVFSASASVFSNTFLITWQCRRSQQLEAYFDEDVWRRMRERERTTNGAYEHAHLTSNVALDGNALRKVNFSRELCARNCNADLFIYKLQYLGRATLTTVGDDQHKFCRLNSDQIDHALIGEVLMSEPPAVPQCAAWHSSLSSRVKPKSMMLDGADVPNKMDTYHSRFFAVSANIRDDIDIRTTFGSRFVANGDVRTTNIPTIGVPMCDKLVLQSGMVRHANQNGHLPLALPPRNYRLPEHIKPKSTSASYKAIEKPGW